jgi:tetratricopeptide (TPR) repeat protein
MRRARLLTLAVALLGGAADARADADAEAWDLLQRGTALYQRGEYVAAREALEKARELVPDRVPSIHRWLGLADARLGRCADAVTELEKFLATAPTDVDAAAEATAARDGCKQSLSTHGMLRIESTPPGSEVRLDADDPQSPPLGLTPLDVESAPLGDHLVSVQRAGYQPASRIVSIAPGQLARVQLTLAPIVIAPPPPPIVIAATQPLLRQRPLWKRRWFWPVVAGAAVAVIAIGVGVGIAATPPPRPNYPILVFQ